MVRKLLVIFALLVIFSTVFAVDSNEPLDTNACAKDGELFSNVFTQYPSTCCEGLTPWQSGFDTREVVNMRCIQTGRVAGAPVGTCINCGDGVCGAKETLCNCPRDCLPNTPDTNLCACTMEYNPVCGVDGVTYGNRCGANCENVAIVHPGECGNVNETGACGGPEKLPCPQDHYCKPDYRIQNSFGTCVRLDCPQLSPPGPDFCKGGTIKVNINESGCKNAVCLMNNNEKNNVQFFKAAYWKCVDGNEQDEKSESCMPYSFWKEKARNYCRAQASVLTSPQRNSQNVASSGSGQVSQEPMQLPSSTQETSTKPVSAIRAPNSMDPRQDVSISSVPIPYDFVFEFRVSDACDPKCKFYVDAMGCKVSECENSPSTTSCPTQQCYNQTWEEIKNIKEGCDTGKQVLVNFVNGCNTYVCVESTKTSSANAFECLSKRDIPQEKIDYCEKNGGKFISKENEKGCIVVAQCVGQMENVSESVKPINKKILMDSTRLLSLALTLETLRIDLQKTAAKVQGLADYYNQTNDTNSGAKFARAAELIMQAVKKVDETKNKIKENVSSFSEEDALMVRNAVNDIRETLLKEALLAMLE